MKMEQIECSETSAYTIQTSGNYPEESIQYSEHGENLKSRIHKRIVCNKIILTVNTFLHKNHSPHTSLISKGYAI